jgi:hypothetical protein
MAAMAGTEVIGDKMLVTMVECVMDMVMAEAVFMAEDGMAAHSGTILL